MDRNTSATGTQPGYRQGTDDGNVNYNVSAVQVGNQVRDGDEFILLTRSHQSEGFKVWSSGDPEQTEQLYRQAAPSIAKLETTS